MRSKNTNVANVLLSFFLKNPDKAGANARSGAADPPVGRRY
jgi:hypothetical protein